jgi:uncharacterized iron-regulated membrane protein
VSLRTVLFWLHLLVGVAAGAVILFMSVTGVILAFEPQLTEWLERDRRVVTPPPDARSLSAETILARARAARPEMRPTAVTLRSDPTASAVVSFGREGGALFVDPYGGVVLGGLSPVHDALHEVVEWHRWLGSREIGRPITGAANLAFLGLVVVGVYLWWPRRWTAEAVKAVTLFRPGLAGRARDFNWHNVIGVWCAPVLLVLTLTGVVMSYQWANDLLYRLTGNEPPPPPAAPAREGQRGPRGAPPEAARPTVGLDALWARAERQAPGWVAISARLPQRPDGPVTFFIQEPAGWHPAPRSQLVLDATTGEVVRWEPYAGQNLGRRLRVWVRPLHTGEAAGPVGQAVAMLASAGGVVLVWTGVALAWRRFQAWRRRTRTLAAIRAGQAGPEVSTD